MVSITQPRSLALVFSSHVLATCLLSAPLVLSGARDTVWGGGMARSLHRRAAARRGAACASCGRALPLCGGATQTETSL